MEIRFSSAGKQFTVGASPSPQSRSLGAGSSSTANCKGFTLIELLAVVTIIGILAAIAIPQFKEYRSRAYDARAQSDLRNAATAQEAYFLDYERYSADPISLPGFVLSEGVQLNVGSADELAWLGSSYHEQGTRTFCFNSATSSTIEKREGTAASCS